MKYFVLAGEASGDKQAALLCKSLQDEDQQATIRGWGGEAMSSLGVTITRHYRELAYMGFVEVIKHLPAIFRNFRLCKKEILSFNPDALILVDYPGFNLRMASWAYKQNIPVYYYISPQLWAWHTSRVHQVKRAVRRMYVILPFEKEFYSRYDINAMYIGHPLAIAIREENLPMIKPLPNHIALLPGSRRHEVELILPEMVGLAKLMPEYRFRITKVFHLPKDLYDRIIDGLSNVEILEGNMHEIVRSCEAAIVTSGTATLETALLNVPQVVVYKGNPLSYSIAKRLVKVPFISLVNLIAGKQLVPELIQSDCTAITMHTALKTILEPGHYERIKKDYLQLHDVLLSGGGSDAAAKDIISDLQHYKQL